MLIDYDKFILVNYVKRCKRRVQRDRSCIPLYSCCIQIGDLLPFLLVLSVMMLAYGVALEGLLHPGTSWHPLYLLYWPRAAFWPIFGEFEKKEHNL